MSERRLQTEQSERADESADQPDEPQQSDAKKATEIADAKEKSGEETVVRDQPAARQHKAQNTSLTECESRFAFLPSGPRTLAPR
jgi:hypothetical protein